MLKILKMRKLTGLCRILTAVAVTAATFTNVLAETEKFTTKYITTINKDGTVTVELADKPVEVTGLTVTLDGNVVDFPDAQPFINKDDRTLVPIRFVSEAMGAEVSWESTHTYEWTKGTVTIVKGNETIIHEIGDLDAKLNGVWFSFDTVSTLKEDRTFVPLRFIAELLNCNVEWVNDTRTVVITSPAPPVAFPEPEISVRFPESKDDPNLFEITLDNIRDYADCENYQFKIDMTNPVEFNVTEQYNGTAGWSGELRRNAWRTGKLTGRPNSLFWVIQDIYTTRANKETLKLYDGMPLEFTLSVKRLCSGEVREYTYTDTLQYDASLYERPTE